MSYTNEEIRVALTRELTDERVALAAAYWLDASPHERWVPDGIILARYTRYAMAEIERLRAEVKRLREERRWISVKERLPETRQRVLVLIDREKHKHWITCAKYIAPRSVLAEDFIDEDSWEFHDYDEETDTYWAPSGFYESNYYTDANYYIDDAVTHWMPLPAPPGGEIGQ